MWNVPQDVWQQYPTVAAWMQHCETMGSGVYMQQVDLPASQGAATVYLVCRNGVTNPQSIAAALLGYLSGRGKRTHAGCADVSGK